jgi:hypothetical protein
MTNEERTLKRYAYSQMIEIYTKQTEIFEKSVEDKVNLVTLKSYGKHYALLSRYQELLNSLEEGKSS